jgi:AraC-like DNA-binding protein
MRISIADSTDRCSVSDALMGGDEHLNLPEQTRAYAAQRKRFPRRVSFKSRPAGWGFRTGDYSQRCVDHVLSGEMLLVDQGRELRLTAGWTLLCFRGNRYELSATRPTQAVVAFNSSLRVEPLNLQVIALPPDAGLSRLARALAESVASTDRFQLDLTLAAGDHLAAAAYSLAAGRFERPRAATGEWVEVALRLLDSHADSDRPLREILAGIPIAYEHLLRLVAGRLGMPARAYRIRRRVEAAKELLLGSGDDITGIAMQLGYSSSQHFATEFRRVAGRTPTAFRAQAGRR